MKFRGIVAAGALALCQVSFGIGQARYVSWSPVSGGLALARGGRCIPIAVDPGDYPGVVRVVGDLRDDFGRVTGFKPDIESSPGEAAVIVGTIGRSRMIDDLVSRHKIDVAEIRGKWEASVTQIVRDPMPGVREALVIAGSDKRGTIFGAYDLSEQIGVSPWYWWADVPTVHRDALYALPVRTVRHEPAVKYRGIFLNDEAPSLSSWVHEKFGDYNHQFYVHIFELLLRLRANYLWPAMWNNCFSQDDPLNPKLADEYGIVMGTSHVEPMMRADKEWNRAGFTAEQWNFQTHAKELTDFWTQGIDRNKPFENIVTIAMRGKVDTPMSESANISLLERIVEAQRKILAEHVNPDVTQIPQLWALYKEVQEYYDKGMRVPDDVTLLWCDDNWGDIRRLPTEAEQRRSGGAGVYYHFDYVGGPRNYKWINTNPLPKIWEQMTNAYNRGADRIWIVNVGGLKPKEIPTEFFLTLAWDPKEWPQPRISEYTRLWAAREFGAKLAPEIADIVAKYAKYNGRRKPELLDENTYSLLNYQEADRVLDEFRTNTYRAKRIYRSLPLASKDAFFQLVLYPVRASEIVSAMYIAAAKSRMYARQNRPLANKFADEAKELFDTDANWANLYNTMAGGRWHHFMDQTHIGYTSWQEPPVNVMPPVQRCDPSGVGQLVVCIEGSDQAWPASSAPSRSSIECDRISLGFACLTVAER